jgi:protein-tyrosine-phosphatase
MKKVMTGMLAMGVFFSVGIAQTNQGTARAIAKQENSTGRPPMKHKTPDEWVNDLDGVVGLTADQKSKAKILAEETDVKMKALRTQANADREAMKQKRMAIRQEQKAGLDKILNDEQKAKLKAHREAQLAKQGGPQKHRTADEQVNELDVVVTLTPDQKVKVKALVEAKQAKMKALKEEQQKSPDENVFKEKRQEIGKEYRAELDKVLTADQKVKLKAHREAMKQSKPSHKK